jgi:hypothetical protein
MNVFKLSLLTLWAVFGCSFAFSKPPPINNMLPFFSEKEGFASQESSKPTLVVGATGQVGRRVVQQLLAKNKPVRALVRNHEKARELFGTSISSLEETPLQIIVADLGDYAKYEETLDKAVEGCDSIISVSGSFRISNLADFLPWRLFRANVSEWADTSHPYFANYKAQCKLIGLAEHHQIQRFVRLTGLSTGFSPFNFFTILFSALLSMTSRYHFMCESYLRKSKVPHVILRPGGLASEERNPETTNLQVDTSGYMPPPGRVSRSDVAALAVAACDPTLLPFGESYTLAVRAVGEDIKPKPQGAKEDGCATAIECLQQVAKSGRPLSIETPESKPYGIAVGLFVYSLSAITLKLLSMAGLTVWRLALTNIS